MFTNSDLQQLKEKGISLQEAEKQMRCFADGFPFLNLRESASLENGIFAPNPQEQKHYIDFWKNYIKQGHKVIKFVPASGAASRMFKDLFEYLDAPYQEPTNSFEKKFFENIHLFAFYNDLNNVCQKKTGKSISKLIESGDYKTVVRFLLTNEGLNYGALPKGLLKFHCEQGTARTAAEEHLVEGALYAQSLDGTVYIHFTVSSEHRSMFESLIREIAPLYEQKLNVKYNISFSEQKSSTDTLAADENNQPFRENGRLVFRPGGHGALIENLNDLPGDIIIIKNIDNVVPDKYKTPTVDYKMILSGFLVKVQEQLFRYMKQLVNGDYTIEDLREMIDFAQKQLCIKNPETKTLEDSELALYLKEKFNRPIRVCGMVKNVGEPGGGPFLAYNSDGTYSPQILESSQIDMKNPTFKVMFESGTHFNPVDLVCAIKDFNGNAFDLTQYTDPATGFISTKSKNGKTLKALELPGLWNGAMSDWNTIFVEVPIETFNPVKTVNDLLRKEHQA